MGKICLLARHFLPLQIWQGMSFPLPTLLLFVSISYYLTFYLQPYLCSKGKKRHRESEEESIGHGGTNGEKSKLVESQGSYSNTALSGGKKKSGGFQSLNLSREVLSGILRLGYKVPTPIQRRTLPVALSGRDVVAMARTGSGKTAAFLIPLVERLKSHSSKMGARAVVFSPTRELAMQTLRFAKSLGKFTDLKFACIVGGDSMESQFQLLSNKPDVLIATPGRLLHLLLEIPGFSLKSVEYCVFDEADRLFEMGFADQLNDLLERMPESKQTMLFSATLPRALVSFAKAGLKEPDLVRLDVDTKISENLRLAFFTLRREEKAAALVWMLRALLPERGQAMVFVATRHHTEFINRLLNLAGISSEPIYGQMDQTARNTNLARFRAKRVQVLVVTDVAARGLDIPHLDTVINYDFPDRAKLFVHRSGRVARQGRAGECFSLVSPPDVPYMLDLMLFLGKPASNFYESNISAVNAPVTEVYDDKFQGNALMIEPQAPELTEDDGGSNDDHSTTSSDSGSEAASLGSNETDKGHFDAEDDNDEDVDWDRATAWTATTAITGVRRLDEGEGYEYNTWKPNDVHYGLIPRNALEMEMEFVRRLISDDIELQKMTKSVSNAMKLYNKTRAEASKRSAHRAFLLNNERVHPLLMQFVDKGEMKARSYITGLQAFRPQQTIFELDVSRDRKNRSETAKVLQEKRKHHAHALKPRVGSVSLHDASIAAAQGSTALSDERIGSALRAEIMSVSNNAGETVEEMIARHLDKKEKAQRDELRREYERREMEAKLVMDPNDCDSCNEEEELEEEIDEVMDCSKSVLDAVSVSAMPSEKRRLSKHDRKKMKQAIEALKRKGDVEVAKKIASTPASIAAKLYLNDGIYASSVTSSAAPFSEGDASGAPALGKKSQRRKVLRDAINPAKAELFRDEQQWVSHAPIGAVFTEAALGGTGSLAEADAPSRDTSDSLKQMGVTRMEDFVLDLAPDENVDLNKAKKRVKYWDPVKKRYITVNASEIVHGRRQYSKIRNESGAKVDSKKKHEYGEIYQKWVSKTRRHIGDAGGDSEPGVVDFGDDGEEPSSGKRSGKFNGAQAGSKGGNNVKNELKSAGDISRARAQKARSQGKFKTRKDHEATPVSRDNTGKIRRGAGSAPSRSKVIIKGLGATGFGSKNTGGRGKIGKPMAGRVRQKSGDPKGKRGRPGGKR